MKKVIVIITLFIFSNSLSQSIRKNFTELTASEKSELQNALYVLRDINGDGGSDPDPDDDDLIQDLANFHSNFFDIDRNNDLNLDIHFNLPTQINIQIFFGWHRYQMFELEQALQDVNPKLSLAYWDSSVDNDLVTLQNTLFGPDILGPFDTDWAIGRNLGSGNNPLPTPAIVSSIQSMTEFANSTLGNGGYSNQIERNEPHVGSHIWTGGFMPTTASPGDPVFYFHHSWVDKLWSEWEDANPGASSFIIQSMIRYDGTYVFNGQTLPLINPNDIVNTRSLGVFYADNGLAELDNYSVSNDHKPIENFYYQYTIEAGNNFTIPNGKVCEIESVNMILLEPGFTAENGASFLAKIDTDNDITTTARDAVAQNRYNPFNFNSDVIDGVYEKEYIDKLDGDTFEDFTKTRLYPNPFNSKFTLTFDKNLKNCIIEIFDIAGKQIFKKSFSNTSKIIIENLGYLSAGNYILNVSSDQGVILNTKILKL